MIMSYDEGCSIMTGQKQEVTAPAIMSGIYTLYFMDNDGRLDIIEKVGSNPFCEKPVLSKVG